MIRRAVCLLVAALITTPTQAAGPARPAAVVDTARIQDILRERVDRQQQHRGIVVGIIEPAGRRVIAWGSSGREDGRALDGDTIFEIGSVTKVFTALLLADAAQRGEVRLDQPVRELLPEWLIPQRGRPITLQDLAQHVSGLPREIPGVEASRVRDHMATFDTSKLRGFLSTYALPREAGQGYEYSNVGMGLLGYALATRLGGSYESLLRERVLLPLQMASTAVQPPAAARQRIAEGFDRGGRPSGPMISADTFIGAGALRSSANDLLRFLAAVTGETRNSLSPALQRMLAVRHATNTPRFQAGLGWGMVGEDGRQLVYRNGGTPGFSSWIGFDPDRRIGVVVLANTNTGPGVDDIGMHLLDPANALRASFGREGAEPGTSAAMPAASPQTLQRYVGRYQLSSQQLIDITREGGRLMAHLSGFPPIPLVQQDETLFLARAANARFVFEHDAAGDVTGLAIEQGGTTTRGERQR